MYLLGLVGYPLGHSFSRQYFSEKFARQGLSHVGYELFPLPDIRDLPRLLKRYPRLRGFNVTIPHKRAILPYLHAIDPVARAVGAVNTVVVEPGGRLVGYNTDVEGFRESLLAWWATEKVLPREWRQWRVLILGTGGSARAVGYALEQLDLAHSFVSRRPTSSEQLGYADLNDPEVWVHFTLVVNTTPLGMYPEVNACPDLPFSHLSPRHWVFDLVYNPAETLLLQQAKRQGSHVTNGLDMLYRQAEAAWAIWKSTLA